MPGAERRENWHQTAANRFNLERYQFTPKRAVPGTLHGPSIPNPTPRVPHHPSERGSCRSPRATPERLRQGRPPGVWAAPIAPPGFPAPCRHHQPTHDVPEGAPAAQPPTKGRRPSAAPVLPVRRARLSQTSTGTRLRSPRAPLNPAVRHRKRLNVKEPREAAPEPRIRMPPMPSVHRAWMTLVGPRARLCTAKTVSKAWKLA